MSNSDEYQNGWDDGYDEGRDQGQEEAEARLMYEIKAMREALINARSLLSSHTGPDDAIAAACLKQIDDALSP